MVESDMQEAVERRAKVVTAPARRKRKGRQSKLPSLRTWGNLPGYLKDNEFIMSGYRANWSFRDSLRSLFLLHNETGNVWSHLLGFFFFLHLTIHVATSPPSPQQLQHLWSSVNTMNLQIEDKVHSVQESLGLRVESLKVALNHSLFSLHRSLETKGAAMKLHILEHLEVARETTQDKVNVLKENLHHSYESLSEGIHNIQEAVGRVMSDESKWVEPMAGTLGLVNFCKQEKLLSDESSPQKIRSYLCDKVALLHIKENLEKAFGGLQDNLHHVQEVISGNLDAMRGSLVEKLRSSFANLHDSLHHFQEVLQIPEEEKEFDSMMQCPLERAAIFSEVGKLASIHRWPVYLFMLGAMSCMLISSTCHLFACCSEHVSIIMWRIDYTGIALLIVSSFYPPIYYGFLCHPLWSAMYLSTISVLGVITLMACTMPQLGVIRSRTTRAKLFATLGLSGVVPMVHQLLLYKDVPHVQQCVIYLTLMGVTYLFGAWLFATRVPECYFPGRFDFAFHSHQLFHIAVVIGAFFHFQATMVLLDWRETTGGCPASMLGA